MSIDLNNGYDDLALHVGHEIECASYAGVNVALECIDCCEVLIDFDKPDPIEPTKEHA